MRGVTGTDIYEVVFETFQLTRLMRGVTVRWKLLQSNMTISTHTPHARRDDLLPSGSITFKISTHTPHARRDRTW